MLDSPLHEQPLLRYKVDIIEKAFRSFTKTVMVGFFDENMKKVTEFKFGYVSNEEICAWIDEGKDINLNGAYILNFSLTDYRVEKGLDDSVFIKLNNFSAKKAFFDCDVKSDFSYAEFIGPKTIFDAAIFGNGGADFNHANFGDGDTSFKKGKFGSGMVNFQFATFGAGDTSFNGVCFGNGNVSFVSTDFNKGNADFKNTYWGDGVVDFKFGKFSEGDVTFEKAQFGRGKKDFKNLEFGGGKIDFRRVEFNDGDVCFDGVEFGDGKVSFRSSSFGHGEITFKEADFAMGEVQFDQVDFGSGKVSFNQAKADHMSFKNCPLNAYMDLRFASCNLIELSNTVVRDIVDLMPEDNEIHLKELNIIGMRILGKLFIDWKRNDVFNLIYVQKETTLEQKAEQFRTLKENFRNNGQYEDEDKAYLEFKRCESKAHLEESIKKGGLHKPLGYINYYFQLYVFDFVGRYATDPTRVIANMLISWFTFSIIYYVVSELFPKFGYVASTIGAGLDVRHDLGNSFYYSGITFFTIGYGDYFAMGYLKPVAVFEGFSGVFLMSYFTVAFVRKILR
ncbi:MAG: two pore domain potassium channel family protein [Bacteroidia bacterium]|nr:two pore domain potassium channel family protein [Bacteroidia bacterium]